MTKDVPMKEIPEFAGYKWHNEQARQKYEDAERLLDSNVAEWRREMEATKSLEEAEKIDRWWREANQPITEIMTRCLGFRSPIFVFPKDAVEDVERRLGRR